MQTSPDFVCSGLLGRPNNEALLNTETIMWAYLDNLMSTVDLEEGERLQSSHALNAVQGTSFG